MAVLNLVCAGAHLNCTAECYATCLWCFMSKLHFYMIDFRHTQSSAQTSQPQTHRFSFVCQQSPSCCSFKHWHVSQELNGLEANSCNTRELFILFYLHSRLSSVFFFKSFGNLSVFTRFEWTFSISVCSTKFGHKKICTLATSLELKFLLLLCLPKILLFDGMQRLMLTKTTPTCKISI